MSRLDWKKGKFSSDMETDEIHKGLRGWRDGWGDWVDYFRFDRENSEMDFIYDEAIGVGRTYKGPIKLDAQHVVHMEGDHDNGDTGFYFNDELTATVSYDIFIRTGMTDADVHTSGYLKDRILYDNKIFRVYGISIEGQMQRRDTIVQIQATQMKPDELVDDSQFAQWSA